MSDELKSIRERHEAREPWVKQPSGRYITAGEAAIADRATLLSALTAAEARAEAAEARVRSLNELLNNVQSDLYDAYQEISELKGTPDGR